MERDPTPYQSASPTVVPHRTSRHIPAPGISSIPTSPLDECSQHAAVCVGALLLSACSFDGDTFSSHAAFCPPVSLPGLVALQNTSGGSFWKVPVSGRPQTSTTHWEMSHLQWRSVDSLTNISFGTVLMSLNLHSTCGSL